MTASDTAAEDPFAILGETLETAASSLDSTTENARSSARRAAAATKRVVGSGSYSASYGLAYGVVWVGTYLHDLLPAGGPIQRGFADGTHDALAARDRRLVLHDEPDHGEPDEAEDVAPSRAARRKPTRAGAPSRAGAPVKRHSVPPETRAAVDKLADTFEDKT